MCNKLTVLILFVLVITAAEPLCLATIAPITSVTVDNPPGTTLYNLQSITVGNYTVDVSWLGTGTSTTTLDPVNGTALPVLDDLEIGVQYSAGEPTDEFTVYMFGGRLWSDSNGDNPDFFLFEAGDGDPAVIAAILPGGQLGQTITLPDNWGGDTGYDSSTNAQNIIAISFAITDLLDAAGNPLTNSSTIEGLAVTSRGGLDPSAWCAVMPPPALAKNPEPADGAVDVPRDVVLAWTPGDFAPAVNGHRVYFSENFNDVSAGIGGLTQSASSYDPGRLEFGTTYYWRVDETSAPPDSTVYEGAVWSFTIEPVGYPIAGVNITATASSTGQADFGPEKTIDGSGLDDNDLHSVEATDMWLSANEPQGAWIQYDFDKPYKLHEMWVWNSNQIFEGLFGFGMKDVTVEYSIDGTDWMTLAALPEFARAPGTDGYAHGTTVDFGAALAKYVRLTAVSNWGGVLPQFGLSEVRFFFIPLSAREPSPDSGATEVDVDATLGWRAGREAGRHDVYVSTDEQAVIDGTIPAASVTSTSYSSDLDLGSTYYWRVDEVNEAKTPTAWQGDVWSFSTSEFLVVDDFESYNNIDPPDPDSHRIFESWSDGFGVATNGALIGYDPPQPSYTETTIVHGGRQAMPLFYSNTAGAMSSEAARMFAPGQDWTKHGIQTLVLYFHGTPGNTGQLYAKVSGVNVAYPGDATDIAQPRWKQWSIDLPSLGVNLASITTLALGIDGNGAAGTLYVDDVVLYRSVPEMEEVFFEAEAGTITAPMKTYNDPLASGGMYIGTDDGIGDQNNDPPATGVATYNFTALGGVYKIALRVKPDSGNSVWVRIVGATDYSPGTHTSGWIRFNDIEAGADWHWDEVHSNDHNNEVVRITLPAGQHSLQIAYREDGCQVDAILITADVE